MKQHILFLVTLSALLITGCSRKQPQIVTLETYTEQDVADFVTPGRTRDEIIARFGPPSFQIASATIDYNPELDNSETVPSEVVPPSAMVTNVPPDLTMYYNLPLPNPGVSQTSGFAGFQVSITNGVVASWIATRPRQDNP
jgi:hypothetical protein